MMSCYRLFVRWNERRIRRAARYTPVIVGEWCVAKHTFAVEWTPEELIFYTDGKVTRRVNRKDDPKQVPSAYQKTS